MRLPRSESTESLAGKDPILGLPPNPEQDIDEVVKEVKAEIEARQRKGMRRADTAPSEL